MKMSFRDEKEAKILFQKIFFYNALIEKPRINRLKNRDLLHQLPFYDELSTVKISQERYASYARIYKIEIICSKYFFVQ